MTVLVNSTRVLEQCSMILNERSDMQTPAEAEHFRGHLEDYQRHFISFDSLAQR